MERKKASKPGYLGYAAPSYSLSEFTIPLGLGTAVEIEVTLQREGNLTCAARLMPQSAVRGDMDDKQIPHRVRGLLTLIEPPSHTARPLAVILELSWGTRHPKIEIFDAKQYQVPSN